MLQFIPFIEILSLLNKDGDVFYDKHNFTIKHYNFRQADNFISY